MRDKLYSVICDVIDDAVNTSRVSLAVFDGAKEKFSEVCDIVDELTEKVDLEDIYVDADSDIRKLSVCILCDELVLGHGRSDSFFDLIKLADSFSFEKEREDVLKISLHFFHGWRFAGEYTAQG